MIILRLPAIHAQKNITTKSNGLRHNAEGIAFSKAC